MMRITKLDTVIFAVTLIFSAAAIGCSGMLNRNGGQSRVVIEVDGAVYGSYLLEDKELLIQTDRGRNRVVISREGVCVTESDCPDHREVVEGMIRRPGQALICLPHRLVITIAGESGEADVTTY